MSSNRQNLSSSSLQESLRTHSYPRFMARPRVGLSLYERTFKFANSPMKRSNKVAKHGGKAAKRRSLEVSRCTNLEQKEEYRRLINQYLTKTSKESLNPFGPTGESLKDSNVSVKQETRKAVLDVIDLTGRKSPEMEPSKPAILRERLDQIKEALEVKRLSAVHPVECSEESTTGLKKPSILKEYISPYLSEHFISDLNKTYGRRERQRQARADAEETRARLLREKREKKDAILAEILHQKLKLKEQKIEDVPKLPELTGDMNEIISQALVPYPPQQVLSENFNISITREHLSTLFGLNWLNDEIINFYMELMIQRSKDQTDLPSVHAMNTFFYPRLKSQGYNSVRRWTKKVDIFSKDLVFYPIHLGVHWCLAVIDFLKKEIRYYDSMGGTNRECLETLRDYLQSEYKNKKGGDYDVSPLALLSMADIPQQLNGSDCGVFTCKFAEYISLKKPLSFSQSDMPYFRKAMVWEILNKKLLR